MKKTPHREQEELICALIDHVGKDVRERIRAMPQDVHSLAWATIAAGILGAALHDSPEPQKVVSLCMASVQGMLPHLMLKDLLQGEE